MDMDGVSRIEGYNPSHKANERKQQQERKKEMEVMRKPSVRELDPSTTATNGVAPCRTINRQLHFFVKLHPLLPRGEEKREGRKHTRGRQKVGMAPDAKSEKKITRLIGDATVIDRSDWVISRDYCSISGAQILWDLPRIGVVESVDGATDFRFQKSDMRILELYNRET